MDELTVLTINECGWCGDELDQSQSRGNPRGYCSDSHRVQACRRRAADRKRQADELAGQLSELKADDPPRRRLVHRGDDDQ